MVDDRSHGKNRTFFSTEKLADDLCFPCQRHINGMRFTGLTPAVLTCRDNGFGVKSFCAGQQSEPMTAEIAVMNKIAVALAADSAATSQHGSSTKIYNSADKLFQLDGSSPVGIMTYGAAEFMGIPWETVIKLFRNNHTGPHTHLKLYGDDFLRFLKSPELLTDDHINQFFLSTANAPLVSIRQAIYQRVKANEGTPEATDFAGTTEKVTVEVLNELASGQKLPWASDQISQDMMTQLDSQLEAEISKAFAGESIGITAKQNLKQIIILIGLLKPKVGEPNVAGLAIAGFGEAELFPDMWSCIVRSVLPGRHLQSDPVEMGSVGLHCGARIIPFAQAEMVHSFMRGIDPRVQEMVFGSFNALLQKLVGHLSGHLQGVSPDQITQFKTEADATVIKLLQAFQAEFEANSLNNHISPVLGAVGVLPKDELAFMAETLVALTSFKRRMSRDAETVGGAIDVAVISKGDGFVWIKRKHYFDPALNVRYMKRLSKPPDNADKGTND